VPEQQLCRENVNYFWPALLIHPPLYTVFLSKLRRFLAQLGTFVVQMNTCTSVRRSIPFSKRFFIKIFH